MGLSAKHMQFLLSVRDHGVSFDKTVTIGRQFLHLNLPSFRDNLARFGIRKSKDEVHSLMTKDDGYAEGLLTLLGATETDSIDVSDYEGASIIHDMNRPVPEELHERFTAVIDGGSLEHVMDFLTAVHGCMQMVKPGGHFLGLMPANNQMGHGFYQFSPELLYRVFSDDNGFKVERLLVSDTSSSKWFEVADPSTVRDRVERMSCRPTYVYVQARKVAVTPPEIRMPQQSDYVNVWEGAVLPSQQRSKLVRTVKNIVPYQVTSAIKGLWHPIQANTELSLSRQAFRRVDITRLP